MADASELDMFCREHNLPAEIVRPGAPTPTVEAAARAMGCAENQIVKSILFMVDGQPVVGIAGGTARIDQRVIAGHYGLSKKRVRVASAEEVYKVMGYPVGACPPFGYGERLATLLDRRVLEHTFVYAGGGETDTLLRVDPREIVRVTGAIVLDLLNVENTR